MKNVLVTGGIGFIGHHLVDYLLKNTDWNVTVLDRIDASSNQSRIFELESFQNNKERVKFVWHDLRAEVNDSVSNFFDSPEIILHLAAGSHVDRSIDDPLMFVQDNVVGTCNLLNYARTLPNLELFVYFSTDEVFGPAEDGELFKDDDRYNSGNPYSASKAGGEELAVAFHNTYGLPVIITHCMNVFGERQYHEKFIPSTIRKLNRGETIQIHCDKNLEIPGSRVYMHAEEVCDALVYIVKKGNVGEKYNIAPVDNYREIDNETMALMISELLDKEIVLERVVDRGSGQGYDLRYGLDGTKLKNLGWKSNKELSDYLKQVVEWSMKNERWI